MVRVFFGVTPPGSTQRGPTGAHWAAAPLIDEPASGSSLTGTTHAQAA